MCALYFRLALIFVRVAYSASDKDSDTANADWLKITAWINSNGGYVDPTIRGNMTSHSGFSIRGVVSGKGLRTRQSLISIPKKLWLTLDNFPDIRDLPLEDVPKCGAPLDRSHLNMVKMAGAIARETRKGNASFYHVYLAGLPTGDDFRSFHPRFMKADMQEDFAGLPMAGIARELQLSDVNLRECFQSWTKVPNSIMAAITLDELEAALMQYRTRTFGTSGTYPSMIPGADFLNTDRPIFVNTVWEVKNDHFDVDSIPGKVASGAELYYMYCKKCDNEKLMAIWGLYLENNENPLPTTADCTAQVRHGKFKSLREASEAVLDLKDVAATKEARKPVPRCNKAALSSDQGPLRCSFARLAWEHCAQQWGYLDAPQPAYALVAEPQRGAPATFGEYMQRSFSQSYMQEVHPVELTRSRSLLKSKGQRRLSQLG